MTIFLKQAFRSFAPPFIAVVIVVIFANHLFHDHLHPKWLLVLLFPVFSNQFLNAVRHPGQLLIYPIQLSKLLFLSNLVIITITTLVFLVLFYITQPADAGLFFMQFLLLLSTGNTISSTPMSYRFRLLGVPVLHFFLASVMVMALDGFLVLIGRLPIAIPLLAAVIASGWIISLMYAGDCLRNRHEIWRMHGTRS